MRRTRAYRQWVADAALPVWSAVGFDSGAGRFRERLDWAMIAADRHAPAINPETLAEDVLGPLLSHGALAVGAVWAVAAIVLPWMVRGRSAGADVAGAAVWSTGLAAGTGAVAGLLPWGGDPPAVHNLVGSAVVAGILAVLARAVRAS